jgi:hypothetical protein
MITKRAVLLLGVITCLAAGLSCAQNADVVRQTNPAGTPGAPQISGLGDPVPPITVLAWIKGGPVKIQPMQPGTNVYVVVFCELTRANDFALTNLSDLQKRYRDQGLIVAAICNEHPDALKEFIKLKADEIDFTVAADDPPGRTARSFRQTFGQMLETRAYIVSHDGELLWCGHPLTDGMGEAVDEIISGRYDLVQAQHKIVATEQMQEYLMLARQGDTNSLKIGRMLLAMRANDPAGLCDLASQIAIDPYIMNRDAALANAALDRAEQLGATNTTDIAVDRAVLLFQTGQEQAGLAKARQALADARTDDEKNEAQFCIHAMEVRLEAAKTNQITAPPRSP